MMSGAMRWRHRSMAWSIRARSTGDGRPTYCAAPSTTIAAAGRAVSRCSQYNTPISDTSQTPSASTPSVQPSRHQLVRCRGSIVSLVVGAIGVARPRKVQREARALLRHHRRFPPAPAPLVEQVGERVLVVARMACETQDDGLIFFHGREN